MAETWAGGLAHRRAALHSNPKIFIYFKLVEVWTGISCAPTKKVDRVIMSQQDMGISWAGNQHAR